MNEVMKTQHVKGYAVYDLLLGSRQEISHFVQKQELHHVYGKHFERSRDPDCCPSQSWTGAGSTRRFYSLRYKRDGNLFEVRNTAHSVPYVKRQYFRLDDAEFVDHSCFNRKR